MKNIYLIKQDPNSSKEDVVWVQMGRKEFGAFIQSDAANGRCFARLPKDDDEAPNIIYETDKESYADWRVEKRHFQYLRDCEIEKGYELISYDALGPETELSAEGSITDISVDAEVEALHQVDLEILSMALKELSEEEYQLIHALYLMEKPMTVRELGKQLGVHFTTVSKRTRKVLEKLKKFF